VHVSISARVFHARSTRARCVEPNLTYEQSPGSLLGTVRQSYRRLTASSLMRTDTGVITWSHVPPASAADQAASAICPARRPISIGGFDDGRASVLSISSIAIGKNAIPAKRTVNRVMRAIVISFLVECRNPQRASLTPSVCPSDMASSPRMCGEIMNSHRDSSRTTNAL